MTYLCEQTQSYLAGVLTARLYNRYHRRKDLPSVVQCMRDFNSLKTVFSKYYNLLKNKKENVKYFEEYEQLNKQFNIYRGDYSHFMLGYSDNIKRTILQ